MTGRLEGKVAFITGAARGQGRAHAVKFASEGADIIAIDRAGTIPLVPYDSSTMDDLDETIRLVEALDRRVIFEPGDVREREKIRSFLDASVAELGRLDIVVANTYGGKKMQPFMVRYTARTHAVTGMTRAFAAELGKHSIRVNSVHPGAVNTPLGSGDMIEAITRTNASNPPLAALGTPFLPICSAEAEDLANAVAFLASDDARLITSEHPSINAGMQYF